MKVFLSSTFRDLVPERDVVLGVLRRRRQVAVAMEDFLAGPAPPLDTALTELRGSDLVLLILGFESGSLLPDGSGRTYTRAEYDEARRLGLDVIPFLRVDDSKNWVNRETLDVKRKALEEFKGEVGIGHTWRKFATPDGLALAVFESLVAWDEQGRPGARKTFSSATQYFAKSAPQFSSPILDLSTTLVGRDDEIESLNAFLADPKLFVSVLCGRGGIGKSKLLQDWATTITDWDVALLKYSPLWYEDSDKEIPVGPTVIIVDDAHRPEIAEHIRHTVQLFSARRARQPIKLLFSTRPGVTSQILRDLRRQIAESEIKELPELFELTRPQAEELARSVLGPRHHAYAKNLAEIAGESPLVIVAGGRLLAAGKVELTRLSDNAEFRSAVFDRFIDELHLEGPEFAINPPRQLLDLIAALGPVDVQSDQFLRGAEEFLRAQRDQILRTVDALAVRGILSNPEGPVRVLPDVLSDFILEECCVSRGGASTRYADRLYGVFGGFFFKALMQNLAELDWRVGRGKYGLSLLDEIWRHIEQSFLAEEPHGRRKILEDLGPAAFFQPERILNLIDIARSNPASYPEPAPYLPRTDAQDYVLSVVPRLLEATAHDIPSLQRSVDTLWSLSRSEDGGENSDRTARNTLKRLASYQLNGWATFNFLMLLQCVRLSRQPGAFESSFTPIDVVDQILEREGEFTESDGNTFRFGGFGLNYVAVEHLRKNAIDFLEYLTTEGDDRVAVRAIHSLDSMLHDYLNRVGREPSNDEVDWQNSERLLCLNVLMRRLERSPISLPVRSEIYDAIRSATGFHYTEPVRLACEALLPQLERDSDLVIFDALSRREGDLPLKDRDNPAGSWMEQYSSLIAEAQTALSALDEGARASKLIEFVKTAHAVRIETRGFSAIVHSFSGDVSFIRTLSDQLIADEQPTRLIRELSITLDALHSYAPQEFRDRAIAALLSGTEHLVLAASSALRVYNENATRDDANLIREYAAFPNPSVKRNALFAIAYMGKNHAILRELRHAALSVEVGTDESVADALADAFGPYGVPVSLLTPEEMTSLLTKFVQIEDFDSQQGAIPRFLGGIVGMFPDQVLNLLLERLAIEERRRTEGNWSFRALGISYHTVSFGSVPIDKKPNMLERCLAMYLQSRDSADSYAGLFWSIDPLWEHTSHVIIDALRNADPDLGPRIDRLLRHSPRGESLAYAELARAASELPPGSPTLHDLNKLISDAEARRRPGAIQPLEMEENYESPD